MGKGKRLFLFFVCAGVIASACFGCGSSKNTQQVDDAKKTLETLLTTPDQRVSDAYDQIFAALEPVAQEDSSEDSSSSVRSLDGDPIDAAYQDMLGTVVSDSFIEQCIRGSEITTIGMSAIMYNYTTTPEEVVVKESGQKDLLTYDAKIKVKQEGKDDQTVSFSGKVQYNDEGKIDTITASGNELTQFYSSLSK